MNNKILDKNYDNILEYRNKTNLENRIFIVKNNNEYIKSNTNLCDSIINEFIKKYNYKNGIELKKYNKSLYCSIYFSDISNN